MKFDKTASIPTDKEISVNKPVEATPSTNSGARQQTATNNNNQQIQSAMRLEYDDCKSFASLSSFIICFEDCLNTKTFFLFFLSFM